MPTPAYVNSSAYAQVTSAAVPSDGLSVTFPASLVAGNLLTIQFAGGVSANFADDIYDATAAGQTWTLHARNNFSNSVAWLWWK